MYYAVVHRGHRCRMYKEFKPHEVNNLKKGRKKKFIMCIPCWVLFIESKRLKSLLDETILSCAGLMVTFYWGVFIPANST